MRLELETRRFYLGRDYSEAVYSAGATPVQIPLISEPEYLSSVLEGVDGILLPGSDTDPDPELYNEEPHPKLKKVVPEKDNTDLEVLRLAEVDGLPVLGICYGLQILNVSRGGSLIQDIESIVESPLKHEQGPPLDRTSHSVEIESGSLIAGTSKNGGRMKVNSHHHQAIGRLGTNLKAIAHSSDGVIEAVQDTRSDRFVLGVQWHPELSWRSDELSRSIFSSFVSACRSS